MLDGGGKLIDNASENKFLKNQQNSVIQAPNYKIKACAVPKTCQKPYNEQVTDCFSRSFFASAERKINIAFKPASERHMPSSPEFADACGVIGIIKVFREIKAEHFSQADSHIAVARKIKINLKRESDNSEPCRGGGQRIKVFRFNR